MYFQRMLETSLRKAFGQFPVALITGARQTGKSTLLQHMLPGVRYITLDDTLLREMARQDPALFIRTHRSPLIIDEIQYAPELLPYIKMQVDQHRRTMGQYILTGSQIFPLMKGVSESLAGRIAIFNLYPFSWSELPDKNVFDETLVVQHMLQGFYPEFFVQAGLDRKLWHSSYLTTYLEKDLRALRNIRDLGQFHRFLILLAARAAQLFNLSEIGKECGISQTTAKDWLTLLQATAIIHLLEPYAKNITKRLVKSPKILFMDTGMLCYLLRIESSEQLLYSPFIGHIFENMVIAEIIKQFAGRGERAPCYFYRSSDKSEIDLIIAHGEKLDIYEVKFSASPKAEMTRVLAKFKQEHPVESAAILNLRKDILPFSSGITAEHWSRVLAVYGQNVF